MAVSAPPMEGRHGFLLRGCPLQGAHEHRLGRGTKGGPPGMVTFSIPRRRRSPLLVNLALVPRRRAVPDSPF